MRYTIKKGDTLSQIAKKNGLKIKDLMSMNPSITDPDKIRVGAVLNLSAPKNEKKKKERIPAAKNPKSTPRRMMPRKKQPAAKKEKAESTRGYTVKSGDTLSDIAKKYGTTVNTLMEMNTDITNANKIRAGQKIAIGKGDVKNPYKNIDKKELNTGEFDTNNKKASRAANKTSKKDPKAPDASKKAKTPKVPEKDVVKSKAPSGRVTITDLSKEPGLAETVSDVPAPKKPVSRYSPLMRKGR